MDNSKHKETGQNSDMHAHHKMETTTESISHDMHAHHKMKMTTDLHAHHKMTTESVGHDIHAHHKMKMTTESVGHDMHAHHKMKMTTESVGHDMHAHHNQNIATENMGHDMHAHHMQMTPASGNVNDPTYHVMNGTHSMSGHDMHVHNQTISGHGDHMHHLHGDSSTGAHGHHHAHAMTFHTRDDDYILFHDWQLSPGRVTFLVCMALFIIAIVYQLLKMARARLGRKCPNTNCRRYILSKRHILQTGLYVVQFVVGYILMLVVMTYNVWIMAATVIGLGIGYFFFGWAEYEEIVRMRPMALTYNRSVSTECGGQLDQELIPLSKESATSEVTFLTSSVGCSCDNGQSL